MGKESFLLVSLKESKAKKLAQVISNESCRKILDYLGENKDSTESELSEKLDVPISTVHYNLKHLTDAGLVTAEEYHYSEKGKEVNHYKLANKYIIIAPKSTFGIKEKLKSILPVSLVAIAVAGVIGAAGWLRSGVFGAAQKSMEFAAAEAPQRMLETAVQDAAAGGATEAANLAVQSSGLNPAVWFIIGAFFTLAVYFLVEAIRARQNR